MQEQYFTLERIGEIIGKNPATIRTHINRGFVLGMGPRASKNKEKGKHERFSIHSLTEFALAYRLESVGVVREFGFKYAAQFAHVGGSDFTKFAGGQEVRRLPSMPYHYRHGHTYMGMMAGESAEVSGDALAQLRFHLCQMTQSPLSEPMVVIDITEFFKDLCGKLDLIWQEELDAAYPETAEG